MEPQQGQGKPHLPPPSLWPIGFAIGIVCILVGLIVSWPAAAVGAVVTVVFGFLWVRDVTGDYRRRDLGPPHAGLPPRMDLDGHAVTHEPHHRAAPSRATPATTTPAA